MQIILSVLLFVFKSLFLSGFELSDTLTVLLDTSNSQVSEESNENQFQPIVIEEIGIEFLLVENNEQEEKSESEIFPVCFSIETFDFLISNKDYIDWQTSFYSSKPKIEGIKLYDLFGCWKTHLA